MISFGRPGGHFSRFLLDINQEGQDTAKAKKQYEVQNRDQRYPEGARSGNWAEGLQVSWQARAC